MRRLNAKLRFSAAGTHLSDRRSGWNVLLDEIVAPPEVWARSPRQVSIALTNRCDLACEFCYAPKSRAQLAANEVKIWLKELDENAAIGVGFGGGEPTLHPDFVELCRFASESTRLAVTFTTHGHHLSDRLLAQLDGHVHFIRISMDGVGATYEALRGRSFDALCDRIRAVRRITPFGLNVVVNRSTLGDLSAASALAADLGAAEILLLPEEATSERPALDDEAMEALRRWVRAYRGPVRLAISAFAAEGFPTVDPLTAEAGLDAFAHIDARGILKRTSFDADGVAIDARGVMTALDCLRHAQENHTT